MFGKVSKTVFAHVKSKRILGSSVERTGKYENLFGKFSWKLKLEAWFKGLYYRGWLVRFPLDEVLAFSRSLNPQTWKQLQSPALPLYAKCHEVVDGSDWRWPPNEYHIWQYVIRNPSTSARGMEWGGGGEGYSAHPQGGADNPPHLAQWRRPLFLTLCYMTLGVLAYLWKVCKQGMHALSPSLNKFTKT